MQTPAGQKAYRQMYNIPDDVDLSAYEGNGFLQEISESVYDEFYNNKFSPVITENTTVSNTFNMAENNPGSFDDSEYRYEDHFNF